VKKAALFEKSAQKLLPCYAGAAGPVTAMRCQRMAVTGPAAPA
jgi:hypothetical protein